MEESDKNLRFSVKDKNLVNSMEHKRFKKFHLVYVHLFRQFYVNLGQAI